jgi:hypothetical protein
MSKVHQYKVGEQLVALIAVAQISAIKIGDENGDHAAMLVQFVGDKGMTVPYDREAAKALIEAWKAGSLGTLHEYSYQDHDADDVLRLAAVVDLSRIIAVKVPGSPAGDGNANMLLQMTGAKGIVLPFYAAAAAELFQKWQDLNVSH